MQKSSNTDDSDFGEVKEQIRHLGITDDGAEMFMMNLNTYRGGAGEDPTANEDYQTYGRGTLPLLLSRASHPIYYSEGIQTRLPAQGVAALWDTFKFFVNYEETFPAVKEEIKFISEEVTDFVDGIREDKE